MKISTNQVAELVSFQHSLKSCFQPPSSPPTLPDLCSSSSPLLLLPPPAPTPHRRLPLTKVLSFVQIPLSLSSHHKLPQPPPKGLSQRSSACKHTNAHICQPPLAKRSSLGRYSSDQNLLDQLMIFQPLHQHFNSLQPLNTNDGIGCLGLRKGG